MSFKKSSSDLELIKWISIVSMLIDHVGMIFYPDIDGFRYIGRFAFIGFAFLIAYNYRYNTKNKFRYKYRLFIFAIISQPIFQILIPGEMNILFLLLMGIFTIYSIEEIKKGKVISPTFILFGSLEVSLFSGYFLFGVLVILFFYYSLEENKYIPFLLLSVALLNFSISYGIVSLAYLILIYFLHAPIEIKRVQGFFFYLFYPLHLSILYLIKILTS